MPVAVAEYLGQRTDLDTPVIEPVAYNAVSACPFMAASCSKVKMGARARPQLMFLLCMRMLGGFFHSH